MLERPGLALTRAAPVPRFAFHCAPEELVRLAMPPMLRSGTVGEVTALRLAPDECWLFGAPADVAALAEPVAPHALVDISARNLRLVLEGPLARQALNSGCPLDLADPAFPAGACTRTLLGKLSVMLWRPAQAFRYILEYTRSFDGYAVEFIRTAALDLPGEEGEA